MWGLTDGGELIEYEPFDAAFGITSDKKPITLDRFAFTYEFKTDALKRQREMKYKRIAQCLNEYCGVINRLTHDLVHSCNFPVHVLYEGNIYCGTWLSCEFVGLYCNALTVENCERKVVEVDKCQCVADTFEQVYKSYCNIVVGNCSQALREMANELSE